MSRISSRFSEALGAGRKLLIPYITGGDPDIATSLRLMRGMAAAGADIIEVGIPFSDPMADGPVIQAACERALRAGVSLRAVIELVREFRVKDRATPVVLMGYLNPIETMGYQAFARAASEVGVDGVLTVDLPPEEAAGLGNELSERGIDRIYLLAPTSSQERVVKVCQVSSGFVYYVSLKGVTGAATLDIPALRAHVALIRTQCRLPIGVGFGIKDAKTACDVAQFSDAVVIGSALVREIANNLGDADAIVRSVCTLISEIRANLDAGPV